MALCEGNFIKLKLQTPLWQIQVANVGRSSWKKTTPDAKCFLLESFGVMPPSASRDANAEYDLILDV